MYVLKMDGGKELITTVRQSVYQGEKNADTLIILVPKLYDNFDMTTGSGTLQYMLPDTDAYVDLELTPTEHNAEYMAYTTQLGAPITSATGIVLMRLQIKDADGNVILVSGNASLPILCRDGTIPDVSAQDKDKLARLAEQVGLLKQVKADSITYDAEQRKLQLTADGLEVGQAVTIPPDDYENPAKATLKTLITKIGGTVGDEPIDQYPRLADEATRPDQWNKSVLLEGDTLKDISGSDIRADVKNILGGDIFYVDVDGDANRPSSSLTTSVTQDQLVKAYESGNSIVLRLRLGVYTGTLPLFVPGNQMGMWLFSGAGGIQIGDNSFDPQTLTAALIANGQSLTVEVQNTFLADKNAIPQMSADTAGKCLLNDGEKAQWQDMSPLIVNITKDGQDESGEPIYKSDKTFDEIKAAYDVGREIKLGEIGDFDSGTFQYYCGSEPKLISVSDNSVGFLGTGNTTALFNNELNLVSQYGGLPTLFTSIEIRKTEKGDVVEVSSSFTIDNEKGQVVFDPEFITKLSPGSGNLIPVTKTDKGLECGVADETVLSMMSGWLEGINEPTKPISYSPTQILLLDGGYSLGMVYSLCHVGLQEISGEGILTALFVNAVGTGVSFIQMSYYSNKAHWDYYDYPFDFSLLKTDATDNGKFLRIVNGEWKKSEFDGSDLSFNVHNANVNDFLRVASVVNGVPTSWKVDTIANAKGENF
nr:MAG TPA: hypothetical protein [Caudoviricetes sp.]